ncbi:WD40/YVTN/BNR-like repeat-containing protein, partial [candidate division KSB1 bacterium]
RLRNPYTGEIPGGINSRQLKFAKTLPTIESFRLLHPEKLHKSAVYGWKSRGPYNVGGRTKGVAYDIRDENILLAGAATGGMWKSVDNGNTWKKTTNQSDLHSVTCLIQDTRPGKEDTWYYGTGEYIGTGGEKTKIMGNSPLGGDGIFKSTDNGDTWSLLDFTSTGRPDQYDQRFDYIWNLAVDQTNLIEDEVYSAAYGSIFRSIDGGNSWESVLGGASTVGYSDVAVTSEGIVYATLCWGTSRGIWRSEDGVNWTSISPPNWPEYTRRTVIGIAPSNEDVVYFLSDLSTTWTEQEHKFWKYTYLSGDGSDAGGIWEDRSDNIPDNFNSQLSFCLVNKVYPDNEDIVFIGGVRLYRSTNGLSTKSYSTITGSQMEPYNHCDQHSVIFSKNDSKLHIYLMTGE